MPHRAVHELDGVPHHAARRAVRERDLLVRSGEDLLDRSRAGRGGAEVGGSEREENESFGEADADGDEVTMSEEDGENEENEKEFPPPAVKKNP